MQISKERYDEAVAGCVNRALDRLLVQLAEYEAESTRRQTTIWDDWRPTSKRIATRSPTTIDLNALTVGATISTESRVPMVDWERGEVVDEILLTSGGSWPIQVPLLNCHDRTTTKAILGSVRRIRVSGEVVEATLHFSTEARKDFDKVRDGHATDVSVGYRVVEKEYVGAGKTWSHKGRKYEGPVNVVTKWDLREVSLVPIGADQNAKIRSV